MFYLLLSLVSLEAGTLRVNLSHQFGGKPLVLDSLRFGEEDVYSVSRLSYFLSGFELQAEDGSWRELPDKYAWLDARSRRNSFMLKDIPAGSYKSFRFQVGIPKAVNHGDPAQYAADHPLNPNLNNLHWDWSGGYIFLALEGRYRNSKKELEGYVYHLANDQNLSSVQISVGFRVKNATHLALVLDVEQLLTNPREVSFEEDGNSTHSHLGDPIASALVANLQSVFSIREVSYSPSEVPMAAVTPKFLPKEFKPYRFTMSRRFPMPLLPRDNPLLEERVALGRSLFHDTSLSSNGMVSCASCHDVRKAFTDGLALSKGVEGRVGDRNSMPLFNLAWKSSFFWDGRASSLRSQVLDPIQDHREMAAHLPAVLQYLEKNEHAAFEKAFGPGPVTEEKVGLALENFLLTLTSYDSKFDRAAAGEVKLSPQEERGMMLFFTEYEPRSQQFGADCFHCHGGANFSDHQLHNNGLDDPSKFVTPSLRNVALTGPYMHDGRFKSLEEVVAHYSGPMPSHETLDPNLAKHPKSGLQLNQDDQAALVAFLKSLTDPQYEKTP